MKTKIRAGTLLLCGMLLMALQGCYNAATYVIENDPQITKQVSFKTDLVPIFNADCNHAGCHNTGGRKPDLTADKAYTSLVTGGYLNTATPEHSTLYLSLSGQKSPRMPLGGPYNPQNVDNLVLAWITQGAKNN